MTCLLGTRLAPEAGLAGVDQDRHSGDAWLDEDGYVEEKEKTSLVGSAALEVDTAGVAQRLFQSPQSHPSAWGKAPALASSAGQALPEALQRLHGRLHPAPPPRLLTEHSRRPCLCHAQDTHLACPPKQIAGGAGGTNCGPGHPQDGHGGRPASHRASSSSTAHRARAVVPCSLPGQSPKQNQKRGPAYKQ